MPMPGTTAYPADICFVGFLVHVVHIPPLAQIVLEVVVVSLLLLQFVS